MFISFSKIKKIILQQKPKFNINKNKLEQNQIKCSGSTKMR